ncbi:MAG: hypothetical protein CVT88_01845 [Candidatus Altiarchaeales archaeon HGW-Altiarchaeales-1]|nr:MAG: hypothetical protein CVT88_01845 [Candidatus Altiarchaeales archaeon HGW-Altiarchaeales-1]
MFAVTFWTYIYKFFLCFVLFFFFVNSHFDRFILICKDIINADKNLRAGDECLVVDKDDNLIATGTLMLAPGECTSFKRGVAVRVR